MTGENTGPAGADATASPGTGATTVHTLPTLADHGSKQGHFLKVHTVPSEGEAAGVTHGQGDTGAAPVMVFAPAPPWTARPGRRPVVAVPDTGVESHSWLTGSPGDPVVRYSSEFGWSEQPSPTPDGFLDDPLTPPGSFRGHATFVAGVIRQTAPAARILSVPVMNNDGAVDPDKALDALERLSEMADSGDADRFVDVICLAFGYEDNGQPDDKQHIFALGSILGTLAGQGVLIVASAGNRGETTPVTYPAAFAQHRDPPVISVGAKNPDGKTAASYSNFGDWVTYQAIGSEVISTFAQDDLNSGFARWSGTSFSAARIAGLLAQELSSAPDLGDVSREAAAGRAKAALAAIEANRWQAQP